MAHTEDYIEKQLENLGNRFREIRIKKGYSNYEQFAFDHEIPRTQYGRYEKGSDMRISSLLKVLDALDMTLAEFFAEGFDGTKG